jgi:hypothetical protein
VNEALLEHLNAIFGALLHRSIAACSGNPKRIEILADARQMLRDLTEGVRRKDPVIDLRTHEEWTIERGRLREGAIQEIQLAILLVRGHGITVRHDFERVIKRSIRRNELAADLYMLSIELQSQVEREVRSLEESPGCTEGADVTAVKQRACALLRALIDGLQRGDGAIDIRFRSNSHCFGVQPHAEALTLQQSALRQIWGALEQLHERGVTVLHELTLDAPQSSNTLTWPVAAERN